MAAFSEIAQRRDGLHQRRGHGQNQAVMLVLAARRTRSAPAIAMLGAVAFAFSLALHDFAVQHGLFRVSEFYLLHLGIPVFLLIMTLVLLDRFLKTLQLANSMHDSLAAKVSERERELLKTHERLRRLERLNATAEERQRIMQNLHDGVGSQLITSLMLVKAQGTTVRLSVPLGLANAPAGADDSARGVPA